jgi:hypothetical protein
MPEKRVPMQVRESTLQRLKDKFAYSYDVQPSQDAMLNILIDEAKPFKTQVREKYDDIAFMHRKILSSEEQRFFDLLYALTMQYSGKEHKRGLIRSELDKLLTTGE